MERDILKKAAAFFAKESMWSSASSQSTEGFGRFKWCARRSMSKEVAFMLGCHGSRANEISLTDWWVQGISELYCHLPNLWCMPNLEGHTRAGLVLWSVQDWATDEGASLVSQSPQACQAGWPWWASARRYRQQSIGSAVCSRCAEQKVGS